jgi:hypothetical protein
MGFEPTTPTLARLCSTTELHPRYGDNANRWLVYNPSRGAAQEAKCSPAPTFTQLFPGHLMLRCGQLATTCHSVLQPVSNIGLLGSLQIGVHRQCQNSGT